MYRMTPVGRSSPTSDQVRSGWPDAKHLLNQHWPASPLVTCVVLLQRDGVVLLHPRCRNETAGQADQIAGESGPA